MYEVEYTIEAIKDLKLYRKHERQLIVDQIDEQLSHEPSQPRCGVRTSDNEISCLLRR